MQFQHLATKRRDFTNFKMLFLALQLRISLIDLLKSIFSQGIVYLLFSLYKAARRAQTTSSDKNVFRVVLKMYNKHDLLTFNFVRLAHVHKWLFRSIFTKARMKTIRNTKILIA